MGVPAPWYGTRGPPGASDCDGVMRGSAVGAGSVNAVSVMCRQWRCRLAPGFLPAVSLLSALSQFTATFQQEDTWLPGGAISLQPT
jgi:hypothetical protein